MPQRDRHHEAGKRAPVKEGWTITPDPFLLPHGRRNLYVDLGAERFIAAERGPERIAVEIKSFIGQSEMADLEQALGQYLLYRSLLRRQEPSRQMVLAVPADAYESVLTEDVGRAVQEDYSLLLLVYDVVNEVITTWQR